MQQQQQLQRRSTAQCSEHQIRSPTTVSGRRRAQRRRNASYIYGPARTTMGEIRGRDANPISLREVIANRSLVLFSFCGGGGGRLNGHEAIN